jgi:phage repressor protein C with HTH and peptisase S24 domain
MDITVKYVSASGEGDYFGISFDNDDPDDDGPDYEPTGSYLIVQRHFEDGDGRICYVETHDEDYRGHYRLRLITFSETHFAMELQRQSNRLVSVSYDLSKPDFEAVQRVVSVIFGD